jgi:hypothetical protein
MGTWKSVAVIQVDLVTLVAHLLVAHHQVDHQADDHPLDVHLHDHQDQIQIAVVKIYRRVAVHLLDQVHQVEIAKVAMQMIRAEFVPPQWIAINQDCAREFLNQIFLKMLLAKNLRKQLAQSY